MTALSSVSYLVTKADKPVLYSFRRCPYAIRARMALFFCGVGCELREVILSNKPSQLLTLSDKATVPVLKLGDTVLDESLDIMAWAISNGESQHWEQQELQHDLLQYNDAQFKPCLDRYKYFDRYPERSQQGYLEDCFEFLAQCEAAFVQDNHGGLFLLTPQLSALDVAIFPFIRQFAFVDKNTFDSLPFNKLQQWLAYCLNSDLFKSVMTKYSAWQAGQPPVFLMV